jgi:hypothetical protein
VRGLIRLIAAVPIVRRIRMIFIVPFFYCLFQLQDQTLIR